MSPVSRYTSSCFGRSTPSWGRTLDLPYLFSRFQDGVQNLLKPAREDAEESVSMFLHSSLMLQTDCIWVDQHYPSEMLCRCGSTTAVLNLRIQEGRTDWTGLIHQMERSMDRHSADEGCIIQLCFQRGVYLRTGWLLPRETDRRIYTVGVPCRI